MCLAEVFVLVKTVGPTNRLWNHGPWAWLKWHPWFNFDMHRITSRNPSRWPSWLSSSWNEMFYVHCGIYFWQLSAVLWYDMIYDSVIINLQCPVYLWWCLETLKLTATPRNVPAPDALRCLIMFFSWRSSQGPQLIVGFILLCIAYCILEIQNISARLFIYIYVFNVFDVLSYIILFFIINYIILCYIIYVSSHVILHLLSKQV